MTKAQAQLAMKRGYKVTHRNFAPNEWMTMKGNLILLEDGTRCAEHQFWRYRPDSLGWDKDYSLYQEPEAAK